MPPGTGSTGSTGTRSGLRWPSRPGPGPGPGPGPRVFSLGSRCASQRRRETPGLDFAGSRRSRAESKAARPRFMAGTVISLTLQKAPSARQDCRLLQDAREGHSFRWPTLATQRAASSVDRNLSERPCTYQFFQNRFCCRHALHSWPGSAAAQFHATS